MAFPPNGIAVGTARMDRLGQAFKTKPTGQAAKAAVTNFLRSVDASVTESTKSEMVRTLDAFA